MRSKQARLNRLEDFIRALVNELRDGGVIESGSTIDDPFDLTIAELRSSFKLKQALERARAGTEVVTGESSYDAGWHDCRERFLSEIEEE